MLQSHHFRNQWAMHPRSFCIVVAEDDEILRYCTVRLLKHQGYNVIEAGDGLEALELLAKCDDAVHLLITNYDMPRLNGMQLARILKAKHEKLMVLLISGALPEIEAMAHIEVLPKPYNEAVLATKVRDLLRRGAASAT